MTTPRTSVSSLLPPIGGGEEIEKGPRTDIERSGQTLNQCMSVPAQCLSQTGQTLSLPACPDYAPESRRCSHYLPNGACSRPDRLMCVEWLRKNDPAYAVPTAPYRNAHLSHSRLSLYERCPQAFRWRYVTRRPEQSAAAPLVFGALLHKVLELVLRQHVQEERTGPLDVELGLRFYEQAWRSSFLTGADLYEEGQRQLRHALRDRGPVCHWDVLGIEEPWELQAGRFRLVGYIDLVERLEGDGLLVTDYKTGALPLPWEADGSLQLTLYDLAARSLWPWARSTRLQLWQLRQGVRLETSRTDEQRAAALAYVEVLGERIEADTEWKASPGEHCPFCSWRLSCPDYRGILSASHRPGETLEEIAQERVWLEDMSKALGARLKETEKRLRMALEDEEEVTAAGMRWALYPVVSLSYPVARVVEVLEREGVQCEPPVSVDGDKLKRALAKIEDHSRRELVRLEIESLATKRIYPRLWCKGKAK